MSDLEGTHVAAMVQNVSLADDNRLCKQVDALCAAGCHVTVITRHDDANAPWRDRPGLTLIEYKAPKDGASVGGHLREYVTSLARQLPCLVRLHRRHRIDVLQICQPPDLYFPLIIAARRLSVCRGQDIVACGSDKGRRASGGMQRRRVLWSWLACQAMRARGLKVWPT